MKKALFIVSLSLTLSACGTSQGVMYGVGEVLNGMAKDARAVGALLN